MIKRIRVKKKNLLILNIVKSRKTIAFTVFLSPKPIISYNIYAVKPIFRTFWIFDDILDYYVYNDLIIERFVKEKNVLNDIIISFSIGDFRIVMYGYIIINTITL